MREDEDVIGRCIGESETDAVTFVSKGMPRVGEYVVLRYEDDVRDLRAETEPTQSADDGMVLGMIDNLVRGSVAITAEIYDPATVGRIRDLEGDDYYIQGRVKIIGDVRTLRIPRTPPPPGTEVLKAPAEALRRIFGDPGKGLCLGTLITQDDVPVYVDTNRMVTRHLAILAMTGAGKSNTVAVITDNLLRHNGCVIIFDMHSEYVSAEFENGRVNRIRTKINPMHLSLGEMGKLAHIKEKAHVQFRYFRRAYTTVIEEIRNNDTGAAAFFDRMREVIEEYTGIEEYNLDRNSITAVRNKIDDMEERYAHILDLGAREIVSEIRPGMANVIDLGTIDEDAADVIVSHVMRNLLAQRKRHVRNGSGGVPFPVFTILEEAHILAPRNRSTDSKYWISRIAREGRKFGVGLCLVSQSPKSLDPDSLAQANNMIISRLVEPQDQRHVQSASEHLSEDLLRQLPSLNIGEAVVVGLMTRVPALIRITKFPGKLGGGDIDIVGAWAHSREEAEAEADQQRRDLESMEDY